MHTSHDDGEDFVIPASSPSEESDDDVVIGGSEPGEGGASQLGGDAQPSRTPFTQLADRPVTRHYETPGSVGTCRDARGGQKRYSAFADVSGDGAVEIQGGESVVSISDTPGSSQGSTSSLEVLSQGRWRACDVGHEVQPRQEEGDARGRDAGNAGGVSIGTVRRRVVAVGAGDSGVPVQERTFYLPEFGSGATIVQDDEYISSTAVVYMAVWGERVWQDHIRAQLIEKGGWQSVELFPPRARSGGKGVVRRFYSQSSNGVDGRIQTLDDLAAEAMSGAFERPDEGGVQGRFGQFHLLGSGRDISGKPVGLLLPLGGGGSNPGRSACGRVFGVPAPPITPATFAEFSGGVTILCNGTAGWCCRKRELGKCTECARREKMGSDARRGKPSV